MECPDCGNPVPVTKAFTPQSEKSAECRNCGNEFDPRAQPHRLNK